MYVQLTFFVHSGHLLQWPFKSYEIRVQRLLLCIQREISEHNLYNNLLFIHGGYIITARGILFGVGTIIWRTLTAFRRFHITGRFQRGENSFGAGAICEGSSTRPVRWTPVGVRWTDSINVTVALPYTARVKHRNWTSTVEKLLRDSWVEKSVKITIPPCPRRANDALDFI